MDKTTELCGICQTKIIEYKWVNCCRECFYDWVKLLKPGYPKTANLLCFYHMIEFNHFCENMYDKYIKGRY